MAKKFCPNCGSPIKKNAKFCPKCGFDLTKNGEKTAPAAKTREQRPRRHMSRGRKALFWLIGILVVAFVIFYAWGNDHYSRNNQINWIVSAVRDPNQGLARYVTTNDPDMNVTDQSLKPLQRYYQESPTKANAMGDDLRADNQSGQVSLVKSGRYLLLFPKYTLNLKTYTPQVETNHQNSSVSVNGRSIGGLQGEGDNYYKKVNPIFPGKYNIRVNSSVSGRRLSAGASVNVWSNKTVNLNIRTETFTVDSVPSGTVYINDRAAGTLDGDGKKEFKNYPITGGMVLYVASKFNGHPIKSENVTDLSAQLPGGSSDDEWTDDEGSGEDVSQNDAGQYIVTPHWRGLISKDDAETLLDDAFNDQDEDDFVGGSSNKDYNDLRKMTKHWDNDDKIDSYDMDVSIVSILPAGDGYSSVVYRVKYDFENEDNERKQVMEYSGCIIHKEGSEQKIQTIGGGKLISDRIEDD